MRRLGTAIALWVLGMAIAVWAGQNPQVVSVQVLGGRSPALPLGLVLVFMAGLGAVLAFAWPGGRRRVQPPPRPPRRDRPVNPAPNRDWETGFEETW